MLELDDDRKIACCTEYYDRAIIPGGVKPPFDHLDSRDDLRCRNLAGRSRSIFSEDCRQVRLGGIREEVVTRAAWKRSQCSPARFCFTWRWPSRGAVRVTRIERRLWVECGRSAIGSRTTAVGGKPAFTEPCPNGEVAPKNEPAGAGGERSSRWVHFIGVMCGRA